MKKALYAVMLLAALGAAGVASANHSWGGYHWARTANPFTLKLGDNVTGAWDNYLQTTSAQWSADATALGLQKVINTAVAPGATSAKNCRAVAGTIQVCNSKYGNNGWLGIAQIWISGGHIVQGTAKMNDTYFASVKYNTPAWRQLVMCQEVAHAFGLAHQNENFGNANVGSCMDYTNAPSGGILNGFNYGPSNTAPNYHDFEQLASMYAHVDSYNSYSTTASTVARALRAGDFSSASQWGRAVGRDARGRSNQYIRDLGDVQVVTHVFWAEPDEHEHD